MFLFETEKVIKNNYANIPLKTENITNVIKKFKE